VTPIWDPVVETMPRGEVEAMQGEQLIRQVRYVFENSPLFRALCDEAHVQPADIRKLSDITKLPVLEKHHLRAFREAHRDPFGGTACVPVDHLYVCNHSTGTTGKPTLFGLTREDFETIGDLYARVLYGIGFRGGYRWAANGIIHWHGYQTAAEYGAQKLGVIPMLMARPPRGETLIGLFEDWSDFDFDILGHYQPEFEIPYLRSRGFRPLDVFRNLRFITTGVDMSDSRRRILEGAWGVPFRNTYGSGDQYVVGGECLIDKPYFHMPEDHYIFEFLDSETLEPVPPGTPGELFVTNLWAKGFPFIRYRMEDVAVAKPEPCPCGRTSLRMRVLGRLAWSVDVAGRRIFNGEVEDVVWSHPRLEVVNYQLLRRRAQPQDRLEVRLAGDGIDGPVAEEAAAMLEERLGVPASVVVIEVDAIPHGLKMQRLLMVD
jgi:phenylacetate-CoA ligase